MMKTDTLLRSLSAAGLALVVGLISARVPSFSEPLPSFSWVGLLVGVGLVAVAFVLSRLFVPGATPSPIGTPIQRLLLNVGLVLFLVALVLFVAILYTNWGWPRVVLRVAIVCGVLTVFALLGTVWFGKKG